jgi:hypothetical protein
LREYGLAAKPVAAVAARGDRAGRLAAEPRQLKYTTIIQEMEDYAAIFSFLMSAFQLIAIAPKKYPLT